MQIAIISDTHLPRGLRRLPDACVERLVAADLVIHAGDFTRLSVVRELQAYTNLIAVHGNVDDYDVRAELSATAEINAAGATLGVIHDAGPGHQRLNRLRQQFPTANAVVFGHSHQPLHETAPDGFQIFNPGSPTERRRAPHHTMGVANVQSGSLTFELIELD
jgi:uncharacterized protein